MKKINNFRQQYNLNKYSIGGSVNNFLGTKKGGFFHDAIDTVGDLATMTMDNQLSTFGAGNVIQDDQYETGFGRKVSDVTGKIYGAAAPMIANAVAPGSGQAVSAAQQGIGAGVGDPLQDKNNRKLANAQTVLNTENQSVRSGYPNNNINQNELRQMARGGYAQPNAELEKGEPYRTPDGRMYKISDNAPTHRQGGVQLNLPQGTEILGKNKIMGQEFKELGSKLIKYQKALDKTVDEPSTRLARDTAKLNYTNAQKQFDALMQLQEMQKGQQPTGQFPYGGELNPMTSIPANSVKPLDYTFQNLGNAQSQDASWFLNRMGGDKAKAVEEYTKTYLKNRPKSVAMMEGEKLKVFNIDSTTTQQDNDQPIVKNVRGMRVKYPKGGTVNPIEEFNKKYGTDYVSLGDFTKYQKGQNTAAEDYEKLTQMMLKQPNYQQLEGRAASARMQADINGVQQTPAPYQYNEREELEKEAQKMYAKGGKIPKYADGTPWSTEEVGWMNNLPDAFYQGFAKSQPKVAGQDVSYDIPSLKTYAGNVTTGQDKYLGGNEWSSYPAMKNYYQNDYSKNYTIAGRQKNTLAPMVARGMGQDAGVQTAGITGKMPSSNEQLSNGLASVDNTANIPDKAGLSAAIGGQGNDVGNYAMAAGIMAPALYNLGRGLFEKSARLDANKYRNPNEDEALGILKNNKYNYDIDPLLREIRTGNNIADYNSKNYSRTTGELANRTQANVTQRNRSMTDAYTQKYNMENQANMQGKGMYAQALMGAGQNRMSNKQNIDMWNMQADAAKRGMVGTALSQGQQGIQQYLGMRNQQKNDQLRMAALQQALQNYNVNPELYGQMLQAGIMGGGNWNWNQPILNTKGQ